MLPSAALVLTFACSESEDPKTTVETGDTNSPTPIDLVLEVDISGTVRSGPAPLGDAQVAALWSIGDDNIWKWGDGTLEDGTFSISFDGSPPSKSTIDGTSLGFLVLFPADSDIPDGPFVYPYPIGLSLQHRMLWKGGPSKELQETWPWFDDLPSGWSCLACVPSTDTFDTLEPVDCSQVEIFTTDAPNPPEMCELS